MCEVGKGRQGGWQGTFAINGLYAYHFTTKSAYFSVQEKKRFLLLDKPQHVVLYLKSLYHLEYQMAKLRIGKRPCQIPKNSKLDRTSKILRIVLIVLEIVDKIIKLIL